VLSGISCKAYFRTLLSALSRTAPILARTAPILARTAPISNRKTENSTYYFTDEKNRKQHILFYGREKQKTAPTISDEAKTRKR